jgi:hypothetical protein
MVDSHRQALGAALLTTRPQNVGGEPDGSRIAARSSISALTTSRRRANGSTNPATTINPTHHVPVRMLTMSHMV